MRRNRVLTVLAAAFAISGGSAALADRMIYFDPAGDVRGSGGADHDIIKMAVGHRNGFLAHTVVTRGRHTDDSPSPEMLVRVGRGRKPDFRVTASGVYRLGTGGLPPRVGASNGTRPGPRTQRLLFRAAAINSPREYDWKLVMGTVTFGDVAPRHYRTHVLR